MDKLLFGLAGLAAGYMLATYMNKPAGAGVGAASTGNCACSNGTTCNGKYNCECCAKTGAYPVVHTVIPPQYAGYPRTQAMPFGIGNYGSNGGLM